MNRYWDIDPQDIDPDTGRPYSNYSSPSLDTSFHDHEMDVDDDPADCGCGKRWCEPCSARAARDLADAMKHFRDAYLNTGCDEEEADQHTEFMAKQVEYNPERLLHEAIRYEDM